MISEAQKMVRKEEKRKQREALAAAKNNDGGDDGGASDYSSSVGGPSDKSGSKNKKSHMDKQSAASPHARSEAESLGQSHKQSIGKQGAGQFSQSDSDDPKGGMDSDEEVDEPMDEINDLPSQNEMKRELILAIEEELREQEALKKQNEEL